MRHLILARHAESAFGAQGRAHGDASVPNPLSPAGEEQARRLGELLADEPLDVALVTSFERTRRTAELALAGRDVPVAVVAELDECGYGRWEGEPFAPYLEWAWAAGSDVTIPGGTESRRSLCARLVRGWRRVLEREEETGLVVAHGLPLRYLLDAVAGRPPAQRLETVPLAEPIPVTAPDLERAVGTLEAWLAAPTW